MSSCGCWRNPETGYVEACPTHEAETMDQMMQVEAARQRIKPCPFCGNRAQLIDAPEAANVGAVVVECCHCRASGPCVFGAKDDPKPHAIEAWNRRAS